MWEILWQQRAEKISVKKVQLYIGEGVTDALQARATVCELT